METTETIQAGDDREIAIPALVNEHGGRMYRLGLRLCGNHADAEDLVQETFLQAYRNWDRFEGRSSVTTWLYTIASRVCSRMHRLKSGEPPSMDSLDDPWPFAEARMAVIPHIEANPAELASRKDLQEQVEQAIAALPHEFRVPFILKEIIQLSINQISASLGIKSETIKTRIHRARLRIRQAIAEQLPQQELPPTPYSEQVCLDLLQAKQEALDRGASFPVNQTIVCARCLAFFDAMDLGQDICAMLGKGELPESTRRKIAEALEDKA